MLGPLAVYLATLPRTVVLEDDGLFLMAGVHLGVAHPPGYPHYTLVVHLFTRLPWAGVLALLGNSLVLILLLGFDFDEFQLAVFRPYQPVEKVDISGSI